jgi:hypothetical protein
LSEDACTRISSSFPDDADPPLIYHDDDDDFCVLDLPRTEDEDPRAVPNQCAICLEAYQPKNTVVWSRNQDCSHAFHQDCILDYCLVQVQRKKVMGVFKNTTAVMVPRVHAVDKISWGDCHSKLLMVPTTRKVMVVVAMT